MRDENAVPFPRPIIMKPSANTYTRRTSSTDLVFSFGLSIVMHSVLLLVDPFASFSVSDRLKEQQSGILMVNLKDRVEPSKTAVAKKVSQKKGEKKVRRKEAEKKSKPLLQAKAPVTPAKPVSPVQRPVRTAKTSEVASAPVLPKPAPVLPSDAPPPKAEAAIPEAARKKAPEPYQPPVIEPDEPDITITDTLKKTPDIVKPVVKPLAPASSDVRKEENATQERVEKNTPPVVQEVHTPIKPEAPPPVPVAAAPAVPEDSPAAPVKEAPAVAGEQPVVAPVQEVQEPVMPEVPPPAPVVTAAAEPEESHAAPVVEEPQNIPPPAKTSEARTEEPVPQQSAKPVPVIPDAREEPAAKNISAMPVVTADMAREKAAEAPVKVVETRAAAVVNKKTISLSLLKRFETDKEPLRIGTPVSKPMIKITAPAAKKVSSKVQEIGGRVKGNGITRVILSINGDSVTVPVEKEKFHWDGALVDGKNTISATAWDRNQYSATDQIIVEAIPARNAFALSLEEPREGEVASPVATVRGKVGDSTVDTVKLIVNRAFVEAAVKENGSFEKTVLLQAGENSLQAEAVNAKGASARSSVLKVTVAKRNAPDILVHLYWEDPDSELRAIITRKKRDNLDDELAAVSAVEATAVLSAREGYRERIFAVYDAKAGAYMLSVTGGKSARCILSVTVPSKRKTRLFGPILIAEEGTFIGRLLMPEGVYWDEDEWFSGKIENGDSVTKYSSSEGMTWKEMK